ncbi:MAG: molybdenum cofactor guanylyltransferase [Flavobacteriales bacterium]|nr:molybdenum cofactor guanylyltransferase [Flavobacteriales bacterium]
MNRTGIILAGGKSSRMNEDKGLMLLDGKPMIQYVIDALNPLVDEIIIVSNNPEYEQFGYSVYEDLIKRKGPLAGIYTGLSHSTSETNIILSCDIPYVSAELLSFLIENNHDQITIPAYKGRTHQLIGVFSKSCEINFLMSLEKEQLKLMNAFKNLNLNVVDASHFDEQLFTNINSLSDIKD